VRLPKDRSTARLRAGRFCLRASVMMDLLAGQLDYVSFAHGLAFVLLASVARALAWRADHSLRWKWLAVYGLAVGLSEWLEVCSLALGQHPAILPSRAAFMLIGGLALLQFCRLAGNQARLSPAWALAPLLVVTVAGYAGGMRSAEIGFRYLLVFPGAAWAAWVFLRGVPAAAGGTRWLRTPGWGFALLAVTSGLTVPAAGFLPASLYNEHAFVAFTGVPVQYARALAGVLVAFGLWRFYCGLQRADEQVALSPGWRSYERGLSAALLLVLLQELIHLALLGSLRRG